MRLEPERTRSWRLASILACSSLASAAGVAAGVGEAGGERRNIVFILTDDQCFDALGLLNDYFRTPNLDRLAEDGLLFENAFVTTSLCSPSRASILSGQYAHAHQVLDNSTPTPRDVPTFRQGLQAAGCETAFVGKWHTGGASDDPRPGFDHWISFRGEGPYTSPALNINGTRAKAPGYTTDLLVDRAVEFIRREHDRPFLLCLSHKALHAPFTPAERHAGAYIDTRYPRPAYRRGERRGRYDSHHGGGR